MFNDNEAPCFFLGLGIGVVIGLLFAPQSGAETREQLLSKADEGKDYLRKRTEELRESAGGLVDRGRDVLEKQKENLSAAVEAGKQAYRETVGEPAAQTATGTNS